MKKETILIGLIVAFIIIIFLGLNVSSETQNQFNDTSTSQNFSGSGDWTNLTYIALPKTAIVHEAYLNITGFSMSDAETTFSGAELVDIINYYTVGDIALDVASDDTVHIVVCDDSTNYVTYYNNSGGSWSASNITTTLGGDECDIVLDSSNVPHICFEDENNGDIYYANLTSGTWMTNSLGSASTQETCAIAVDSQDNIGVVVDGIPDYHFYNKTSGTWNAKEDISATGSSASLLKVGIVFDSNDIPHVTFGTGGSFPEIKYGNRSGGVWGTYTVINSLEISNNDYTSPSIYIESDDTLHIAFIDWAGVNNEDIWYSSYVDGDWDNNAIYTASYNNRLPTVVADQFGNPIVVSVDTDDPALRYLYNNGTWQDSVLSTIAGLKSSEATIGNRGRIYIAYSNGTNIYLQSTPAEDPEDVILDVSNDGDAEFNHTGSLFTQNQTSNFSSEIQSFLTSCTANATGWCDVPLNVSGTNGKVQLSNIFINITEIPRVSLLYPENTTYSATVTQLNYSAVDSIGLDECWYSLNGGLTNTSITCGQNVTGLNSGEGFFNWTIYANDTSGNFNSSVIFFTVAFDPPTISLDYPTNSLFINTTQNVNFNFTGTDPNGLSTCELWTNTTGTWHKNETFTSVTSGVQVNTQKNLTDGRYIYNAWCNDTTGQGDFAASNYTFTIDTTSPYINPDNISITTPTGSQTISFNITEYTELYCNASWYSVYDSLGAIENSISNISLDSCTNLNDSFTVNDVPANTYTLRVYMNDSAGNLNSTDKNFSTIATPTSPPTGGGGGTIIIENKIAIEDVNVTITTLNLQSLLDVSLAKDSVKPRKKEFLITNKEVESIEVKVICDTQNTNLSSHNISICDYVTFEQDTFIVSPNEQEPSLGSFEVLTPPNSSFGDIYYFNILTTRTSDNQPLVSKLSVSASVSYLALLRKWSYVPLQSEEVPDKSSYPIVWVSLFLSFLIFPIEYNLLKKKSPRMAFFLGFVLMILFFNLFLIYL